MKKKKALVGALLALTLLLGACSGSSSNGGCNDGGGCEVGYGRKIASK